MIPIRSEATSIIPESSPMSVCRVILATARQRLTFRTSTAASVTLTPPGDPFARMITSQHRRPASPVIRVLLMNLTVVGVIALDAMFIPTGTCDRIGDLEKSAGKSSLRSPETLGRQYWHLDWASAQ